MKSVLLFIAIVAIVTAGFLALRPSPVEYVLETPFVRVEGFKNEEECHYFFDQNFPQELPHRCVAK